jgi:hypothetical protein
MKEALGSSETSVLTTHGVTSQKTPFFIVTTVKTSNLKYLTHIQIHLSWETMYVVEK